MTYYSYIELREINFDMEVTGTPTASQRGLVGNRHIRAILGLLALAAALVVCFSLSILVITDESVFRWILMASVGVLIAVGHAARWSAEIKPVEREYVVPLGKHN